MTQSDRIAIVTGAGRGIGAAIAQALADEGIKVYGCGISDASPDGYSYQVVDVRDGAAVNAFVKHVHDTEGHIDIVINNAGFAGEVHTLSHVTDEEFQRVMQTNVAGVFHVMHAALPALQSAPQGILITLASRAGSRPHPTLAIYSASKAAAISLTQAVAKELVEEQSNILCCCVSPGGVNTPMRAALFGEEDSGRQQSPAVIAKVIVQIVKGDMIIPPGADVRIVKEKAEIVEMI